MSMIIEQVNYLRNYAASDENLYDALNKAADTIESLSAKLQVENMEMLEGFGRWIPCKERLPEEDKEILIIVRANDVSWIRVGMFSRGTFEILDGMWSFRPLTSMKVWDVTYWMSLPDLYHEP